MSERNEAVIVGGGLAAAKAVESLRENGLEGRIVLIGEEPELPYERPPLSKDYLRGESDREAARPHPAEFYAENDIELRTGTRVEEIATAEHEVVLAGGERIGWERLLVATGAEPRRLDLPGSDLDGILYLRDFADADRLSAALGEASRVAVVGAGWIGAEVATTAAKRGCRVTVVEAADTPLANAIGPEVGALTAPWYAEAGVELRTGVKVAAVDGGGLVLAGGGRIDADEVVAGIGVRPEVSWLEGSGLLVERGVVTDASFRVYHGGEEPGSLRPDVVAVGDCAAWWSRRYGRRLLVEHWDTALNAPETAAAALLGEDASYDAAPYFWSEQFGRMVQYAGSHAASERLVHRGDPSGRKWAAVWLTGDRLDAILTVGRPRDLVQARRVIAAGTPVDPEAIADPDVPVRQAVR